MPKPLSQDIRNLIIYHNKNGAKNTEIVKWLCVSKASVERILRLYREEKKEQRKRNITTAGEERRFVRRK